MRSDLLREDRLTCDNVLRRMLISSVPFLKEGPGRDGDEVGVRALSLLWPFCTEAVGKGVLGCESTVRLFWRVTICLVSVVAVVAAFWVWSLLASLACLAQFLVQNSRFWLFSLALKGIQHLWQTESVVCFVSWLTADWQLNHQPERWQRHHQQHP